MPPLRPGRRSRREGDRRPPGIEPVDALVGLVDVGHRAGRRQQAVRAPPPYSCTRDRRLVPAGETSSARPPGTARTSTCRPPSSGRLSSQYRASPSVARPDRDRRPAATWAAVSGDGHWPYGQGPDGVVSSVGGPGIGVRYPHDLPSVRGRPRRTAGRGGAGRVGPAGRRGAHRRRLVGRQLQGRHDDRPGQPGRPHVAARAGGRPGRHRGRQRRPDRPGRHGRSSSTATTSASPGTAASPSGPASRPPGWYHGRPASGPARP